MAAIVNKIKENSIAEELELQAGDEILSIDEQKMNDLIDYNFLCKSEFLTIEVKKKNGELEEIEIEKDFDEDLGIIFESAVFDKIKPCANNCIFCFVDQQPDGLRDTLYIKDDDYRLSYLQGTYVTFTNLTKKDKERIETLGLGPFYISVHTTNPDLRVKMLKNKNAGKIMEQLKWLEKLGIPVHLQIVLCPKYNDGDELKRTLNDFKKLKNILSVAVVPVGITKYRGGGKCDKLHPVTKEIAVETIEIVDEFNKSIGKQIACCSDEFFAIAEKPIPPKKYYGNFAQLEDGVGALRLLLDDFDVEKKRLPKKIKEHREILFATSQLAKPAIDEISRELNKIKNLKTGVVAVKSDYWGEGVSVAGLITSDDLIKSISPFTLLTRSFGYLSGTILNRSFGRVPTGSHASLQLSGSLCNPSPFAVIIPSVMLRQFTQDFLDGKTLDDVKRKTGLDFFVIKNCYSTKEIVDFILKQE